MIIGITGKARSGKDTVARTLEYYFNMAQAPARVDYFAYPIYEALAAVLGKRKGCRPTNEEKEVGQKTLNGLSYRFWMQRFGNGRTSRWNIGAPANGNARFFAEEFRQSWTNNGPSKEYSKSLRLPHRENYPTQR